MTWTTRPRSNGPGGSRAIFAGQGSTRIILLHGVGLNADAWGAQIDALCPNYAVAAYDMPGHGSAPRLTETPSLQAYTDHVAGALVAPGIVVGHSMGAMIALDLAIRYPHLVQAVVTLNAIYQRSESAAIAVRARAAALDGITPVDPSQTLKRWFEEGTSSAAWACDRWLTQVDPAGYRDAYTVFATSNGPALADLRRLKMPIFCLTGARDPNSTPAMSQALAEIAQKGHSVAIRGAAHMLPMTHAPEVNSHLALFFDHCFTR